MHESADRVVELVQHAHQLLRLDSVDEARPPAEIGEEHRDLAAVALENRLVARGDDRVGELRREEPLQPPQPAELRHLFLHALLERAVELRELRGLRLDRVVVALDPEQRPDAREQLVVVERLRDEVVRAGLDRSRLLLADARGDHDHGQHRGLVVLAQPAADGVAVEPGHHHVEQDQVGLLRVDELESREAVGRGDDVVSVRREHRLEQPHVLGDVVDDEDPARAAQPCVQCSSTVAKSSTTSTGFER